MTPEELDQARSDEAWRIWERQPDSRPETATIAARLAREGWTPPVDPDVLAVRERGAALPPPPPVAGPKGMDGLEPIAGPLPPP